MLATYRDSLRELNQGDLGLLETRLETRLTTLARELETSLVTKRWDLEMSIIKHNWELVKWMFTLLGAYVVVTTTLVFILAGLVRR